MMEEIDAIKALDDIFSEVQDVSVRDRLLKWAWDKYSTEPISIEKKATSRKRRSSPKQTKKQKASSPRPSIVKDINLRPSNKKSFKDFSAQKKPTSNDMRNVVSLYYLKKVLGLALVSFNHIYTCYKEAGWRVPADIVNSLQQTSSREGWLDSSDKENIQLTAIGENLVEHDLPKES